MGTLSNKQIKYMEEQCLNIRKKIAYYGYVSGRGHISSALSLVEIYVSLYLSGYFNTEKIKSGEVDRDRFVLSKGHGALGLYITLVKAGIVEEDKLEGFASSSGILSTHPVAGSVPGVEMTAGSLGQGIGYACGIALGAKLANQKYKIVAVVGDGELQEGSNWESLLFIGQHKLDNFTLIIDRNQMQITGQVDDINSLNPLDLKLLAFGFDVSIIDGHSVKEIYESLLKGGNGKPKAIIAQTVKGKGISFIEGKNGWHGKGLTKEQYEIAKEEMEKRNSGSGID